MTYGGFMALNGLVGQEEKALFAGTILSSQEKATRQKDEALGKKRRQEERPGTFKHVKHRSCQRRELSPFYHACRQ